MAKSKYTDPEGFCLVCGFMGIDIHHIKSRGASGTDDDWNLVKLCHNHHQEIHKVGNKKFAEKYILFKHQLFETGWEICKIRNKWFRPKEDQK